MSRWSQAVAWIAGIAAGGGIAYTAYLTVEPIVLVESTAAPAPAASVSPSASASPSPAPTAIAGDCSWDRLPEDLRPAVLEDEPEGLPEARGMTDAVWGCVGEGWAVEVHSADGDRWRAGGTAQALYLAAPDGDLLKLFDLRTDVEVVLLEADLDARLAWTARVSDADAYQVVEIELETGLVIDDWGGDAIPALQRFVSEDQVTSVAPLDAFGGDGTLWAGYSATGTLQSLFVREEGAEFRGLGAQKAVDSLLAQDGVNGLGEAGDEVWLDRDGTVAMILVQEAYEPASDPDAKDLTRAQKRRAAAWRTGGGTWVVVDLVTDQWRLAEARLPDGLCRAAAGTYIPGTYEDPGDLQVYCLEGVDDDEVYRLSLDADAVARTEAGP
ncbi:hypothetical protein [Demequina mangrovi]|uniref:Uncharacterized protein n=1 Tax=Demequina mangrovi TaxID=1043493 RepID=A0A1H7AX09_9MICO|nr:hypothetical protein [Demequina mangrovi]SEJ66662.1 hypothetical protein SAMN05421637_2611 [Demequina mangrovi]